MKPRRQVSSSSSSSRCALVCTFVVVVVVVSAAWVSSFARERDAVWQKRRGRLAAEAAESVEAMARESAAAAAAADEVIHQQHNGSVHGRALAPRVRRSGSARRRGPASRPHHTSRGRPVVAAERAVPRTPPAVRLSLSRNASASVPQEELAGYTFWSSDFHIAPIADLKDIFGPLGMRIVDESLSGHCHLKGTCAKHLRVLNRGNGINLSPCPNELRRRFFEAYKRDMRTVDAFLCHHAAGLCELFMPFNASLLVIASTRYEIGRHDPRRWRAWNENLKAIARNPRNLVAANNRYDAEYIKYFTGLEDVPVVPNYCGYADATYSPTRPEILVGPGRGINADLFAQLASVGRPRGTTFKRIRDLYPHFEYRQLASHPAIVLVPYQVSIMSIFEYYRMAIPMWAPSPDLLASWQIKYRVLSERTWDLVRKKRPTPRSPLPRSPAAPDSWPDPNNDIDKDAIKFWISFADFYEWPHVQTFDSFDDLVSQINAADLSALSAKIAAHNEKMKRNLVDDWRRIFAKLFRGIPPAAQSPRPQLLDYDAAMMAHYNVRVSSDCVGDSHQISGPTADS